MFRDGAGDEGRTMTKLKKMKTKNENVFGRIKEIEYAPLLRSSDVGGCGHAPSEVVVRRSCRPHPSVDGPVYHARRAVYNAYRTPARNRPFDRDLL